MAITIDQLNIELTADSQKASSAIDQLTANLTKLKNSLGPLANVNVKVSNSFNNTTKNIQKASNATDKYANKANKAKKSAQGLAQKLAQKISTTRTLISVFQNAARTMADWFNESNEYIETLNLFNVTMGEGADEAREFAESLSTLMGIDPAEWMQYQGTFKNLTAGFGVASDKANIMSQNLTQLSYDMASFFNTDVETAFDKLSSAMSGQVKGLREFGIDTTVASLQEYALSKGIDASVRSMSQAEKSLLRYNYIMDKSIIMQGDMARTIVTPANSLRILNAQLTQMKRALGNIVSVIAVKFIPYVQAMVEIIKDAANSIANFFGFELPEIDYSSLGSGFSDEFEDAEDSLDGISGSIKKIKKQLMGFDELNIINNPETDSGGSGGASAGGVGLDLEPLEYNFLEGLKIEKLDEIKEKIKDILGYVGAVAGGIAGWKITDAILDIAGVSGFSKFPLLAGVTLTITGAILEIKGVKSIVTDGIDTKNFTETLLGGGALIAGGALIGNFFGSALVGAAFAAIIAGIPMAIAGIWDSIKNGLSFLSGSLTAAGTTLIGLGIGVLFGPIGALVGALIGLVVGLLIDLGVYIYEKWDEIKAFFSTLATWFDENVIQPISNFFTGLWDGIVTSVSNCWQAIKDFFTPAVEWFGDLFGSIWQTISDVFYNIGVIAEGCWEIIKYAWDTAVTWFNDNVIQPIKDFFEPMWEAVKEGAKKAWEGIKSVFSTVAKFFKDIFTKAWEGVVKVFSIAGEIFNDIKDAIVSVFKVVVNGIIKGINKVISIPFNAINKALDTIRNIEIGSIQPFSKLVSINVPEIPLLAEGGIVNEGQMFVARERGPELVGTIGNKTAVANNDQIISGIESGVYRAMMAANSNKGGSQTIRIINEIDGDVVGEKVIQYHNGRVMQTGASPLLV